MKSWIKFYTEALHDRKMRRLDRFDKSVYYDLLLLAGFEDMDGYLPCLEDIAFELDLSVRDARKSVSKLLEIGIISKDDDNNLYVTNFQQRQESSSSSYERVKRFRNKKRNVTDNAVITDDNVSCNVTDNAYDNVINDNAMITIEEEVEEEEDKEVDKDKEEEREKKNVTRALQHTSTKKKFGQFQNVLLTDEEYKKLQEKFPDADERIEALSIGIDSKGYKYKNHYSTILSWARREEKNPQPSFSGNTGQLKKPVDASGMTPDEVRNNGNLFSSAAEMLRALNAAKERQKNEVVDL